MISELRRILSNNRGALAEDMLGGAALCVMLLCGLWISAPF
ncbi:hypothetical protein SAMN05421688_0931 [Poseidonocella pacifica]|uniref:Uncharacterized protein n=1 Tax=Poseidonocella pacifica TaxID=871651 RepID=A0A1I0VTG7_9RHOB|nr:hypothetical protein [Poseidonocella pacifica]SFA79253.1 hypothetical protein SAMN05421688_0931 [Poseidonocella pacifica]